MQMSKKNGERIREHYRVKETEKEKKEGRKDEGNGTN